jgi:hypothetical protein
VKGIGTTTLSSPSHRVPRAAQLALNAELHRAADVIAGSNEVLLNGGAYADNVVADLARAKHLLQAVRNECVPGEITTKKTCLGCCSRPAPE